VILSKKCVLTRSVIVIVIVVYWVQFTYLYLKSSSNPCAALYKSTFYIVYLCDCM